MRTTRTFLLLLILIFAASAHAAESIARVISGDYNQVARSRSQMWRECIGAGRAGEGLRADWQEQLKILQDEIGFRSLRFHGIFHDEMDVYREDASDNPIYDWKKVDLVDLPR